MDSRPARASGALNLLLPDLVTKSLSQEAADAYPRECCGFLLGRRLHSDLRVIEVLPVANIANREDAYLMAPESVLRAHRTAETRTLDVLAAYHSHPDCESFPSDTDRYEALPGMLHVILSVGAEGPRDIRGWKRCSDGKFEPVTVTKALA